MQVGISRSRKQMGLLIHTSFETPEGFLVTSLYCRIVSFTYAPGSRTLTVQHECYMNREKRLLGYRRLHFTGVSETYSFSGVSFPTMESMYALLKTTFTELGFAVDDIDPDIAPAEPVPTEPVPTEPVPTAPTEPAPVEPPAE
jgi:hypothetical protein